MAEYPTPEPVPENPYQIPDGRDLGPESVFEDQRARGLEGQRTEWRTEWNRPATCHPGLPPATRNGKMTESMTEELLR